MGHNQIYKLLHSKGNDKQNEVTIFGPRGNITNDVANKGLVSKTDRRQTDRQTAHTVQQQKTAQLKTQQKQ